MRSRVLRRFVPALVAAALLLAAGDPAPAGTYTYGTKLTLTQVKPSRVGDESKADRESLPAGMRRTLEAKYRPKYNSFTKTGQEAMEARMSEENAFTLQNGDTIRITVLGYRPSTRVAILKMQVGYNYAVKDVPEGGYFIMDVKKGDDPLVLVVQVDLLQATR